MNPERRERERQRLLDQLPSDGELVLIEPPGGPETRLSVAGARAILAGRRHRRLDLDGLVREAPNPSAIALVVPGPGLLRPTDVVLGRILGLAAGRFERVVLLPGAIDASDDLVRDRLAGSAELVFACESVSRASAGARAQLAPDCCLFFDYASTPEDPVLTAWLEEMATRAPVLTDRAAVLIAAAMLGCEVRYTPDLDGRLDALAAEWLSDAGSIRRLEPASPRPVPRGDPRRAAPDPRVSVVMLTRDRPERAAAALETLRPVGIPLEVLLLDNNSSLVNALALQASAAEDPRIRYARSARNLGCAGGRQRGVQLTRGELVLFLDDDAELLPGALEAMVDQLAGDPSAGSVSATVLDPGGRVAHSGGELTLEGTFARFDLTGAGLDPEDPALPPSGSSGWAPATALLVRRELIEAFPWDPGMGAYFEDNEWSLRVALQRPGVFRRSREARVVHHGGPSAVFEASPRGRALACDWLASLARFEARFGRVLAPWGFGLVPELHRPDGGYDLQGFGLILELVRRCGTDWLFAQWLSGRLAGLLEVNRLG